MDGMGDHHDRQRRGAGKRRLTIAIVPVCADVVLELVGGLLAGSHRRDGVPAHRAGSVVVRGLALVGRRRGWLAAGLVLSAAAGLAAQQQPPLVERVDVSRVMIDVRVINDEGEPVAGLEPDDFDVRIGGEPLDVESALWLGAGEAAGADETAGADGADGVDEADGIDEAERADETERAPLASTGFTAVLAPRDRRQLVVFFVQKSLEADRALGLLRLLQDSDRLLAGVGPDDRVAVVSFEHHFRIWLDFTADLDRVREVLAWEVMHEDPPALEPQAGLSIVAGLDQAEGRGIWQVEDALRRLGEVLEPMPGSKSVVLIGYGFDHGFTRYERALDALDAARAAVFSLDVTQADYHTFEHALRDVSHHTGGLFLTTFHHPRRAIERMASAVGGRYVLFTLAPDLEPGSHSIEVELRRGDGRVLARSTYVHQ